MLEKKLQEELQRYKAINKYGKKLFVEQVEAPIPPPPPDPSAEPIPDVGLPPSEAGLPPAGEPTPDLGAPPTDTTEEIDITDLVNMTKNIKKEIDDNKTDQSDVVNKMEGVFSKLDDLEMKLSKMDQLFNKLDELGSKVESMKEPTPVEKLEMRSLDSYPFSQNPQQFFSHKQQQMKSSGKNEYVLTKDDIQNYSMDTIKNTFTTVNQDEFGI
jgi:hypothetical protein